MTAGHQALGFDIAEGERYGPPTLLGVGAMGRVDAVHDARLGRTVAMKTMRREVVSAVQLRRFVREATLTAGLDHPGIVGVHDAGRRPDGRAFFTMRLVQGRPLSRVMAEVAGRAERERLITPLHQACEAVAYAHDRGIVHRDLKPSNIMLSEFGQVQVVDWGLARRVAELDEGGGPSPSPSPEVARPDLTHAGAIIGTPAYMSPEQARGERATIATDVWALGAILYEVLTGTRLADADPSRDLAAAASGSPELGAIIERALASSAARRYPDAKALADDLGAWLDGGRVGAYRYSTWELARRVAREWRRPLAAGLVALVVLITFGALSYRATRDERDVARAAEAEARDAAAEALAATERAEEQLASSLTGLASRRALDLDLAQAGVLAGEALLRAPDSPVARGVLAALPAEPPLTLDTALALPETCLRASPSGDGQLVACQHPDAVSVWQIETATRRWRVDAYQPSDVAVLGGAGAVRFDTLTGAAGGGTRDPESRFRALADGRPLPPPLRRGAEGCCRDGDDFSACWTSERAFVFPHTLAPGSEAPADPSFHFCGDGGLIHVAAVSPGGQRLLLLCHESQQVVDLATGAHGPLRPPVGGPAPTTARWLRSGAVLVGDVQGGIARLDPGTGELTLRRTAGAGTLHEIQPTRDGRLALLRFDGDSPVIWDLALWQPALRVPAALGREVRLSDDGRWLVAVDEDRRVRRYELHLRRPRIFQASSGMTSARLSPDGSSLAASLNGLEQWPTDGGPRRDRGAIRRLLKGLAFSHDGALIFAVDIDGGLGTWRSRDDGVGLVSAPGRGDRRVDVLAEGWVVQAAHSPGLRVSRPGDEAADATLADGVLFRDLRSAPSGRRAIAVAADGWLFEVTLRPGEMPAAAAVAPWGGARGATLGDSGRLVVIDAAGVAVSDLRSLAASARLEDSARGVLDVALSGDERLVAGGGRDGVVTVWDAETGRVRAELRGHTERVPSVQFGQGDRWLVSGSWDATARLWDTRPLRAGPGELVARLTRWRDALGLSLEAIVSERSAAVGWPYSIRLYRSHCNYGHARR